MTSPPLADQRAALQAVTTAATSTLSAEWALLDTADAVGTRQTLTAVVPTLADHFGAAASVLAADSYTVARADAAVTGRFAPKLAGIVPERLRAAIGWGVDPLFSATPDPDMALYRVGGSLQKSIADQYRDTVQQATLDDPGADGWQRYARSGGCPFCQQLAARGTVYAEPVEFGGHRDCHCLSVPAFTGRPRLLHRVTLRASDLTAADRAATNRWADAHL